MKNLKNIFSIFTLVLLMSFNTNAQTNSGWTIIDGPLVFDPNESTILETPKELQRSAITLSNSSNVKGVKTLTKYLKELKGNLIVTFDSQNKIISIAVPAGIKLPKDGLNNKNFRMSVRGNCYGHDCVTDPQNDASTVYCLAETVSCGILALIAWVF